MTELDEFFEEDEVGEYFKTGAKIWIAVVFAQLFTSPVAFAGGKLLSVFPNTAIGIFLSILTVILYGVTAVIILGVVGRYLWDWK